MHYQQRVIGQCEFKVDGLVGTSTLVETRAARVTQRVEIILSDSRKAFSIPLDLARKRGFWNDEKVVLVPKSEPMELMLFAAEDIDSSAPRAVPDPVIEAIFGKLIDPPSPKPRREHAGGLEPVVFDGNGQDREATGTVDFDYDSVDAALENEEKQKVTADSIKYGADVVLELLNWMQAPLDKGFGITMKGSERNIYIRLHALRYYLDKETMGAPTLEQLKRRLGVSRETLRFLIDDLEKRYGMVSPLRKSQKARKSFRDAPRPKLFNSMLPNNRG